MKCPSCGKPPVSLKLWLLKYSWARWACDHCKIPLKANGATWLFILGGLVYSLGVFALFLFPGAFSMEECLPSAPLKRLMMSLLFLIGPLAPTAFVSYFICGYKLEDGPGADKTAKPSSL